MPPSITARQIPREGDTFNFYTRSRYRVGDSLSVMLHGRRVAQARVVAAHADNPHYTNQLCGGRVANMGQGSYQVRIERVFA